jgi:hypothetical protein
MMYRLPAWKVFIDPRGTPCIRRACTRTSDSSSSAIVAGATSSPDTGLRWSCGRRNRSRCRRTRSSPARCGRHPSGSASTRIRRRRSTRIASAAAASPSGTRDTS